MFETDFRDEEGPVVEECKSGFCVSVTLRSKTELEEEVVVTHNSFQASTSYFSSHLGSDISTECRTRPQYEDRSYCETGSSRLPGSESDIVCI